MEILKTYWFFIASAITIFLVLYFVDRAKTRFMNRSREQIRGGILTGSLSYDDLKVISRRWWQKESDLTFTLELMLAGAVSNEDKGLSEHSDLLRNLKKEHEMNQLFSELPENVRLKLRELQASSPEAEETIHQLATSLSSLYSKNQIAKKRERMVMWLGIMIGIAGLLFSIYVAK
ncbi:hypothetical protein [Alteromonas sp. OM2203]|uniref:hypothetical protein n=1 Tax=Alteromonas sp. OM2203 TaxID=3398817 RepID=UPI003AF351C3